MPDAVSLPQLHHRFSAEDIYRAPGAYRLLPFRFTPLDAERVVATNLVGEHLVLGRPQLHALCAGQVDQRSTLYDDLVSRHFVLDATAESTLDLLATKYRTRYARISDFTALHLFVVTLRCDHSCPYCQVSRVSSDKSAFDMSQDTAERAIDLVFGSPSRALKIEFQGGEPLLNFPLIRFVVERVTAINATQGRQISFVIATNLAQLDDHMLEFCRQHSIAISTSLDGPAALHNANRPRPGNDSYERAIAGIQRCRTVLGHDAVAALMTTTMRSLEQPEAIIDEYVARGFSSIFLRWLSPYGFAARTGGVLGYPVQAWHDFYQRGLRYIIALNQQGTCIREDYATIVLRKMLTPFPTGYVDLQSPSGLGIAVAVYNYDGDVYASDEARMLAETGDKSFCLGNVHKHSHAQLFLNDTLAELLASTMTDATPMCTDCAFEPWCGTDPAFHQATQGDPVGHRPTSAFCARNMHVFRLLVRMLEDEPKTRDVLESWL
jgi:His-Xaa-Ser system radical SAM maturase HxsB